ncbi:MAG: glycosyl hydrolase family 28-related protein, partial [Bacteroides sp.]|nr:glycosyl hydrolase family 28-related protein [Bacteroides sp.]
MRFLVALLLALCSSAASFGQVYNIMDYGAVSDTTQLSTNAIQKAVDDCAAHGGGTVWVPAGQYLSGTVMLKSYVNLHLDAGAIIYASRKSEDFKNHAREIGAADNAEAEMLIGAVDAHDISITGQGTLHCQAKRMGYKRDRQTVVTDSITGREVVNADRYGADYRSKFRKVPPCPGAINLTRCTQVHIQDIQVIESSFWSVHLQWCDRVYVSGIYIMSNRHNGVNADGLDIDGCTNVMVNNCRIDTGDDALCLKTTRQNGETRPCRYITISNCVLTSSSAAMKIGTESHGDFEHITVSNCAINQANRGLNIIVRDGGCVRNVIFSNLTIHTVRKETFWWGNGDPIWFTIQKRGDIPSAGSIENIILSNIIAHGQSGIRMEGFSSRMKNIRLDNVQLTLEQEAAIDKRSRNGFLFHGIDELQLTDCRMQWDEEHPEKTWESAYCFQRINGLTLIRVKGEKAPGSTYDAFRYEAIDNG